MKAPLILFITLFLVCLFSGCGKGSCYYHNEPPCGKVKGHVVKVTDTVYTVLNGEIMYPLRTSEYVFDSLQRLVEEHYCFYYTERNRNGADPDTSIEYRNVVKNRYDRNGRKVESRNRFYSYTQDQVDILASFMRLTDLKGNHEVWEQTYDVADDEKEFFPATTMNYFHEKNRLTIDYENEEQGKICFVTVFDDKNNVIESCIRSGNDSTELTTYKYNESDLLIESKTTPGQTAFYQYDEFDNEGNWLKMIELDENGTIRYIIRRRIEYKI